MNTGMRAQRTANVAMLLTLVPVTLLVPGLHELVASRGGTNGDAHAFMTVNMVAGMIAVPVAMRLIRRWPNVRGWLLAALALDAIAFAGMGMTSSLGALYAFRVLDGAAHLTAVTLLMVASNRLAGDRRGRALGALAAAIMAGVAIGSPLGGWLSERGTGVLFGTGAALFVLAGIASAVLGTIPAPTTTPKPDRYAFNRALARSWIPLGYGFMDRFAIGIFVSTFTLFLAEVHGLSTSQRGGLIALFTLPFALLCYPVGRLAERIGWFKPMIVGNVLFAIVFAAYGITPTALLPVAMVASGVLSALMYTPNLLLISSLAERGSGEGLFGAFQIAGALGFLCGPIVGGVLVQATRALDGAPAYREIFALVGTLELLLAITSWSTLRDIAGSRVRLPLSWRPATRDPIGTVALYD
jgi:MFS family permease